MKTAKKMDQAEMLEHIETLRSQCQQRGIKPPNTSGDPIADVEAFEAALAGPGESKPNPSESLSASVAWDRASQLYEGLDQAQRTKFVAKNFESLRSMLIAADRENRQ